MIVCKACGHQNEDDVSFCGSCGAFLEWEGERVEEPKPPVEAPAPERPGLVERVKQAVGIEESQPAAHAGAAPPAERPEGSPGGTAVVDVPPGDAVAAGAVTGVAAAAAPTDAVRESPPPRTEAPAARPPEVGQPAARPPVARPPERPRPRETRPAAPVRRFKPGDLICGQCGSGNDPQRRFCRTCGVSLATATVVRTPWYRRIFRSRRRTYAAGERPGGMAAGDDGESAARGGSPVGTILRVLFVVIFLAGLAGYALLPAIRSGVNGAVSGVVDQVRRVVAPELTAANPIAAEATTSVAGYEPINAIDGVSNTHWAADLTVVPQPSLTLTFERPVDLEQVLITSGASDNYEAQPRPRDVRFTFSDGSIQDVELRDEAEPQSHGLDAGEVTSVQLQVLSVYGGLQGTAVSITEIEFFTAE